MELILAAVALAFSLVAATVSILLYLHREDTHAITSKLRTVELETADLVDRLSVWQRRDAARQRKVDGVAGTEQRGLFADQHSVVDGGKQQLRAVARARGLMP